MIGVPKPTPRSKEPRPLRSKPHRIPDGVRFQSFKLWGTVCLWCEQPGGALDLHHKVRRSQGGADVPSNLRPVHRKCHMAIHERVAEAKRRGFLAS
jgi:5-methylcytosine-specific restriction endonuclease McrA